MYLLCKEVNYLKKSKEINYIAQNRERYLLQGHEANTGWPDVEVIPRQEKSRRMIYPFQCEKEKMVTLLGLYRQADMYEIIIG